MTERGKSAQKQHTHHLAEDQLPGLVEEFFRDVLHRPTKFIAARVGMPYKDADGTYHERMQWKGRAVQADGGGRKVDWSHYIDEATGKPSVDIGSDYFGIYGYEELTHRIDYVLVVPSATVKALSHMGPLSKKPGSPHHSRHLKLRELFVGNLPFYSVYTRPGFEWDRRTAALEFQLASR